MQMSRTRVIRKKVRCISFVSSYSYNSIPPDAAPPDPRDFAEAVDVVPRLPPSFQAGLTSSKWKERKEVLDQMLALLSATPKIKENSELGDLAKSLAVRIQGDANINCVMVAAGCMEALAKGLMGSFAKYREVVVGPMLERLKERKANVTDAIGIALDAIFTTVRHSLDCPLLIFDGFDRPHLAI